jgi:hypothetical protein
MKKLLIAALIGTLSSTLTLGVATSALAATKHHKVAKKRRAVAKNEAAPEGSVQWSCIDSKSFWLKGDPVRDQTLTLHWANRNYDLPREATTTGANRFHDQASGLILDVIPAKAMLLSERTNERLADECHAAEINQGAAVPAQ